MTMLDCFIIYSDQYHGLAVYTNCILVLLTNLASQKCYKERPGLQCMEYKGNNARKREGTVCRIDHGETIFSNS